MLKLLSSNQIMFLLLYIDLHSLLSFAWSIWKYSNHTDTQIKSGSCLIELMNVIHGSNLTISWELFY